jgi:protein-L-isoaspartate(D-aspartate) O-methyltransferase
MEDRWSKVSKLMVEHYDLKPGSKLLDVGCGKGFLMFDFTKVLPGIEVRGLDISQYAIDNAKPEIKDLIVQGSASKLPFEDGEFDLVISINTFHNLHNAELELALKEFSRVSKRQYLCVESYRNEVEKANLLYWQVTCEQFNSPDDWEWWFCETKYKGDYSFIYFE